MTGTMWIIASVRILGSLPVLKWPFWGGILAILVDLSDLFMMNLIHLGAVNNYQTFDKYLDQVYLLTFLIVALRWRGLERDVSVGLYVYRLAGFFAFEATRARAVLLLFPNLFEFWFLLVAGFHWLTERGRLPDAVSAAAMMPQPSGWGTPRSSLPFADPRFIALLAALFALKLFQEYALHYGRWLDDFTAVEAVQAIWRWLTAPFSWI